MRRKAVIEHIENQMEAPQVADFNQENLRIIAQEIEGIITSTKYKFLLSEKGCNSEQKEKIEVQKGSSFAVFLEKLKKKNANKTQTDFGSAVWLQAPINDIVSDGLWAVATGLATKHNIAIDTENKLLEAIAPRMDKIISNALFLAYRGDMERAAEDFEREVKQAISTNIGKVPADIPLEPQTLWQLASAQFFAKQIKLAREFFEASWQRAMIVQNTDRVQNLDSCTYLSPGEYPMSRDLKAKYEAYFSLTDSNLAYMERASSETDFQLFSEEEKNRLMQRINLLKKIKIDLNFQDKEMTIGRSIERHWIFTQIALEMLGIVGRKTVSKQEMMGINLNQIDRIKTPEFREMMYKRLVNPRFDVSVEDRKQLQILIGDKVKAFQQIIEEMKKNSGREGRESYSLEAFYLAEEYDLEDENKKVLKNTNWKKLDITQFEAMLSATLLPTIDIVRKIPSLKREIREDAVRIVLASRKIDEEIVVLLAEQDLLFDLSHAAVLKHLEKLPKKWIKKNLMRYLDLNLYGAQSFLFFIKLVNRLDKKMVVNILRNEENKAHLVSLAVSYIDLVYSGKELHGDLSVPEYQQFEERVGKIKWKRALLANEIILRSDLYKQEKKQEKISPWEHKKHAEQVSRILGLSVEEAMKVLRINSEEKMYRWLNSGREDLDRKTEEYLQLRNKYFQNMPEK